MLLKTLAFFKLSRDGARKFSPEEISPELYEQAGLK